MSMTWIYTIDKNVESRIEEHPQLSTVVGACCLNMFELSQNSRYAQTQKRPTAGHCYIRVSEQFIIACGLM